MPWPIRRLWSTSAIYRISRSDTGVSDVNEPANTAGNLRRLYSQQLTERDFRSDPAQLAAVEQLDDLRRRLVTARAASASPLRRLLGRSSVRVPERGVYLWGGVGRGKTWLMDLFFQSLPFAERRRRHFHRFMHDVHSELKGLRNRESPLELVAGQIARDTRVLCFDELFVTDIADAMILGTLFENLFKQGVTLVATSNVRPGDLYKDGLQRQRFLPAIELIERHVDVLAVDGGIDYRLRQLTQAGTYLPSNAADTVQRLEALFAELSYHGTYSSRTLEIEGRPIPVVRQSGGAVWFNFSALCSGPRSQDDYIEIAREFQSVIVSDVPILDTLRENEARRFIALVDELYDRNVNLIISAAATPAELYRGDRLSFQFERTLSRLIEMQSEEYLAREHRP
ncbi:MAG: ATPase [Gammaproteobacteria bacterium]|nr:ATPase [Gammaproteobacteria bacterium]